MTDLFQLPCIIADFLYYFPDSCYKDVPNCPQHNQLQTSQTRVGKRGCVEE